MWVPGSVVYLVPAFILVMGLFTSPHMQATHAPERVRNARRERARLSVEALADFAKNFANGDAAGFDRGGR